MKKVYKYHEYSKLLDYCLKTTNLGEKSEKFLKFVIKQKFLTHNQYFLLHEIGCFAVELPNYCKKLHNLKFEINELE